MSMSQDERKAIVEFRIEKALRAYEQAGGVILLRCSLRARLMVAEGQASHSMGNKSHRVTHQSVGVGTLGLFYVNRGV